MQKYLISFILACCASNAMANTVTLRFLNCTGKTLTANWLGFKVNVDNAATDSGRTGQIIIPMKRTTVVKNLSVFNGTGVNSHSFDIDFVKGIKGNVNFTWNADETISVAASNNIYLPNTSVASNNSTVDIQIGCTK